MSSPMKLLKPYSGHSRTAGPSEGAVLVLAHTAREARLMAFRAIHDWFDAEWTDVAVKLLQPHCLGLADQAKLAAGTPHVVDNPRSCKHCESWGNSVLDSEGVCQPCRDEEAEMKAWEASQAAGAVDPVGELAERDPSTRASS